jgi:hypothetical protein
VPFEGTTGFSGERKSLITLFIELNVLKTNPAGQPEKAESHPVTDAAVL